MGCLEQRPSPPALGRATDKVGVTMSDGFIPKHGGYANLLSYQKAEIVFDATACFCRRFVSKRDRTYDQMVQVARASLEEPLADYLDFLRTHEAETWDKNSKEALYVRKMGQGTNVTYGTYKPFIESRPPETVANIIICLIHQANYLLDKQIRHLEKEFIEHGGLRERMTQARLNKRNKQRKNRAGNK